MNENNETTSVAETPVTPSGVSLFFRDKPLQLIRREAHSQGINLVVGRTGVIKFRPEHGNGKALVVKAEQTKAIDAFASFSGIQPIRVLEKKPEYRYAIAFFPGEAVEKVESFTEAVMTGVLKLPAIEVKAKVVYESSEVENGNEDDHSDD